MLLVLKSVQADERPHKNMPNSAKTTSNYAHLVSFSSSYRGASYQMPIQTVVVPHREIQEANTNPMAVL